MSHFSNTPRDCLTHVASWLPFTQLAVLSSQLGRHWHTASSEPLAYINVDTECIEDNFDDSIHQIPANLGKATRRLTTEFGANMEIDFAIGTIVDFYSRFKHLEYLNSSCAWHFSALWPTPAYDNLVELRFEYQDPIRYEVIPRSVKRMTLDIPSITDDVAIECLLPLGLESFTIGAEYGDEDQVGCGHTQRFWLPNISKLIHLKTLDIAHYFCGLLQNLIAIDHLPVNLTHLSAGVFIDYPTTDVNLTHLASLTSLRIQPRDIPESEDSIEIATPAGLKTLYYVPTENVPFDHCRIVSVTPIPEMVCRLDSSKLTIALHEFEFTHLDVDCSSDVTPNFFYLPPSVTALTLTNYRAVSLASLDFPRYCKIAAVILVVPGISHWHPWTNGPRTLKQLLVYGMGQEGSERDRDVADLTETVTELLTGKRDGKLADDVEIVCIS
jgi:hypothetical protein